MEASAYSKGAFMEGVTEDDGRTRNTHPPEESDEATLAKEEAQDEVKILASARELKRAITALLQLGPTDPPKQLLANNWLAQFVTQPFAWTVALYVAFPPAESEIGGSIEVRYFALNILLGKIRSDWIQLGTADAWEMYETVLRQLPCNLDNPWFTSRLLILASAAAAVAGEQAARELVQQVWAPKPIVDGPVAFELLTAVAEEIFVYSRAGTEEVAEAMRDISSEVFQFLEDKIKHLTDPRAEAKLFVCLERWIYAGLTLSELYSTYPNILNGLFGALGSQTDECFEAAVSTLSEFVAAVDQLPERDLAVHTTISAILARKGLYSAAALRGELVDQALKGRSRGLVRLITVLATSEASLLARGGSETSGVLDWLVDASGGGGGLGVEGATIAAVAWPHLAAVPSSKRADILQAPCFAAAAKAILQAERYRECPEDLGDSGLDEEELLRYREGAATEALTVCYKQLGTVLLSHILVQLQQAVTWESAEVCLYSVATLSSEIKGYAGLSGFQAKYTSEGEQVAARSFLSALFVWVSASTPESQQDLNWRHWRLVKTTLLIVENFTEWTAIDMRSLEAGVKYIMFALNIEKVRGEAAMALRELCHAAAPHIIAAQAVAPLFSAYAHALSIPGGLQPNERLAFVESLSLIAAALPVADCRAALNSLTSITVSTVKALAEMRAAADINGQRLAAEIRVLAAVVTYGSQEQGNQALHPALPILHEIWPALDVVSGHWAGDADVVTALCELWGTIVVRLGMVLSDVLPSVICSATAMYKQHLVPACLDCLSNIVLLGSNDSNVCPEVDKCLDTTLLEVTQTLGLLEKIVEDSRTKRDLNRITQVGRQVDSEDVQQQNAETVLCSIYILMRSFLHEKPSILISSTAFVKIFHSATESVRRTEMDSALAGARLLSDITLCLSFSDDDFKGKVTWQLSPELVPHVDAVVDFYGMHVLETVLQTLATFQLVNSLQDALADVLYGLCMRYPGKTGMAMGVVLGHKDFPARKGVLKDFDKSRFISAATRHPVQPRRRFQGELSACVAAFPIPCVSPVHPSAGSLLERLRQLGPCGLQINHLFASFLFVCAMLLTSL